MRLKAEWDLIDSTRHVECSIILVSQLEINEVRGAVFVHNVPLSPGTSLHALEHHVSLRSVID